MAKKTREQLGTEMARSQAVALLRNGIVRAFNGGPGSCGKATGFADAILKSDMDAKTLANTGNPAFEAGMIQVVAAIRRHVDGIDEGLAKDVYPASVLTALRKLEKESPQLFEREDLQFERASLVKDEKGQVIDRARIEAINKRLSELAK